MSCEGTAFFCAGARLPDSRDPAAPCPSLDSRRRSSANLARSLGPTPRTLARSIRLSGRAVTMSRSTASRTTTYGGTPISRATLARHSVRTLSAESSFGGATAPSPGASARRMVPPSRAARAGPTPGTSASEAASVGGCRASRRRTCGSRGQPDQTVFLSANACRNRVSRSETTGFAGGGAHLAPQRSHPAQCCRRSPKY